MWSFVTGFFHLASCFQGLSTLHVSVLHCSLWLNNIPLCGCISHFTYTFISWWTFGLFPLFWLLGIMLLWTFMYTCMYTCCCMCLFLLGVYLGVELLDHMVTLCLASEELSNCCPKKLHHFTFPPTTYEGSNFFISSSTFIICPFDYSHSRGCEMVFHCGFDLHFPGD